MSASLILQLLVSSICHPSSLPTKDIVIILVVARGPSRKRAARSKLVGTVESSLSGYYDAAGKLLGGFNNFVVDIC